jgi:1-acyl-sn-glycerol-3-phosphate acyltransferase
MVGLYERERTNAPKTSGWTFCPPKPNPFFQNGLKPFLPFLFRFNLGGFAVQIDRDSLARLKAIRGDRMLLMPNHPAQWDPWAMFELAKRTRNNFFFVAAREVFDWHNGVQGWFMQRMGCYSVVRGASDKESFKTTKDILAHNRGPVLFFVEV